MWSDSVLLELVLNASQLDTGAYTTHLIIAGNDTLNPADTAAVSVIIEQPPVIAVEPDSLHFTLETNQSDSLFFSIHNTGHGVLQILGIEEQEVPVEEGRPKFGREAQDNQFASHGVHWLSEAPTSGTVAPGDSLQIKVVADASGLVNGLYQALLKIRSNDPVTSVKIVNVSLEVGPTGINPRNTVPLNYEINQNYPNPFNPATIIKYQLPAAGEVQLIIYNVLGQQIRTLVTGQNEAGYHRVVWNGRDDVGQQVTSGIYICRFEAGDYHKVMKLILMK